MRLKHNFVIQQIGSKFILTAIGENAEFHGVIHCNSTAAFIARQLNEEKTTEELCTSLCCEYAIDAAYAEKAVNYVLNQLRLVNALEE